MNGGNDGPSTGLPSKVQWNGRKSGTVPVGSFPVGMIRFRKSVTRTASRGSTTPAPVNWIGEVEKRWILFQKTRLSWCTIVAPTPSRSTLDLHQVRARGAD